jgi:hypothetical protein
MKAAFVHSTSGSQSVRSKTTSIRPESPHNNSWFFRGKENKCKQLNRTSKLTCMDKSIKQAIMAFKETGNLEKSFNVRQALQEKYSYTRSNSQQQVTKSLG